MTRENLAECKPVNLAHLGIKERADLQHVLRDHIEVLDSDLRVIAEEYGNWEDSRRRIDLLAPDKQQRLALRTLRPSKKRSAGKGQRTGTIFPRRPVHPGRQGVRVVQDVGRGTVPALSTLRDAFAEAGVSFQAEE
jgi:hypothetical protein